MLFASDLDSTLIYSRRFLDNEVDYSLSQLRVVETKNEDKISFMTKSSVVKLSQINKRILFVPVTTRSIEQFKRISVFKDEVIPKYAVVSNGGNILIDGNIDLEWSRRIEDKLRSNCMSKEEVIAKFNEIHSDEWITSTGIADNLFCFYKIKHDNVPNEKLKFFAEWLSINNWSLSLQKRKLYLVPRCINKWEAILYIKDRENIKTVASAGDSMLDLEMIIKSDYGICPSHGEIHDTYKDCNNGKELFFFTKSSGVLASDEILDNVGLFIPI